MRVYWLRPYDVPFDQCYPDGITRVVREAQRYDQQELGKTFQLNNGPTADSCPEPRRTAQVALDGPLWTISR